jgi:hypothetical protein
MRRRWRTDGTYERLLLAQHGRCGICDIEYDRPIVQRFDIDHHHRKGVDHQPRGLLCRGCNLRLGRESDSIWLRNAANYLEREIPF